MVIRQLKSETFPVALLCDVLGLCRSAYYAWQQQRTTARQLEDNLLGPVIRDIFWQHRRRYGARRIVAEHEPRRQLLRQRLHGIVLGHRQNRVGNET